MVVDVAKECNIKHFVLSGRDDIKDAIAKDSSHLDLTSAVEKYLIEQGNVQYAN